jgi:hypothetical protein
VQTIPFTLASPIGSTLASIAAGKLQVPPVFIFLAGGALQTIGFALLSTLPTSGGVPARMYGYQWVAGFGVGFNASTLLLVVPFVVERRDTGMSTAARPVAQVH